MKQFKRISAMVISVMMFVTQAVPAGWSSDSAAVTLEQMREQAQTVIYDETEGVPLPSESVPRSHEDFFSDSPISRVKEPENVQLEKIEIRPVPPVEVIGIWKPVISEKEARNLVSADLVSSFGMNADQVKQWLDQGLIKVSVDPKSSMILVAFDKSLQGQRIGESKVDPLGEFIIPSRIEYQYKTNYDFILKPELMPDALLPVIREYSVSLPNYEPQVIRMPVINRYSLSSAAVIYDQTVWTHESGNQKFAIGHIRIAYDDQGEIAQVFYYDGPAGVKCASGEKCLSNLLKQITYTRTAGGSDWNGTLRKWVWRLPALKAEILYPGSTGITKRVVDFNVSMLGPNAPPYGKISSVAEYGRDPYTGKEILLVTNELRYQTLSLSGLLGSGSLTYVSEIVRRNASGAVVSTIQVVYPWTPILFRPEGVIGGIAIPGDPVEAEELRPVIDAGNMALIRLPDGTVKRVMFRTFEELFEQASKFESVIAKIQAAVELAKRLSIAFREPYRLDLNGDGIVDERDIKAAQDKLEALENLTAGDADKLDFDENGRVEQADIEMMQVIFRFLKGDVNLDGKVDLNDINYVNQGYENAFQVLGYLPAEILAILDFNKDGVVGKADRDHVIQKIRDIINQTPFAKAREIVINDLLKSFGFDKAQLDRLLANGLVTIEIDRASLRATVKIDPSVTADNLVAGGVFLANPLGDRNLPAKIDYLLTAGEIPLIFCAEGADCIPPEPDYYLVSGIFYVDGMYYHMDFSGCTDTICPRHGNNTLTKVTISAGPAPCEGPNCMTVSYVIRPFKEIRYEYHADGSITARINPVDLAGGISEEVTIKKMEDGKLHITEIKDIRYGEVIAVSRFEYLSMRPVGPCPDRENCAVVLPTVILNNIRREDGQGGFLSLTRIDRNNATVDVGDGLEHPISFRGFQDLLEQVRKIEKQMNALETVQKLALEALVRITGLSMDQLLNLIEDITVRAAPLNVSVKFKEGVMGEGRVFDFLGEGKLPERIDFEFSILYGAAYPSEPPVSYEVSRAQMTFREESYGEAVRASVDFNVHGDISTIYWFAAEYGAETEIYRDSYVYDTGRITIERKNRSLKGICNWTNCEYVTTPIWTADLKKMVDGKYHIVRLAEYDSDGGKIVSTFKYLELVALCRNDGPCDPQAAGVFLDGIVRTGAEGEWLSTTSIDRIARTGLVDIGDGWEHVLNFTSLENLLGQLRELEKNRPAYEVVFQNGRLFVMEITDSNGIKRLYLVIQAKEGDGYADVEKFEIMSWEAQNFEDGRIAFRFKINERSDGDFQTHDAENEPLVIRIREYENGVVTPEFGHLTVHTTYVLRQFTSGHALVKTQRNYAGYRQETGEYLHPQYISWLYDDAGSVLVEEIHRRAGDYILQYTKDFSSGSMVTLVRFWKLGEGDVRFENELKDVTEWASYGILTALEGKTPAGELVKFTIRENYIEMTVVRVEIPFAAGRVIVEEVTGQEGTARYFVKILDANGNILELRDAAGNIQPGIFEVSRYTAGMAPDGRYQSLSMTPADPAYGAYATLYSWKDNHQADRLSLGYQISGVTTAQKRFEMAAVGGAFKLLQDHFQTYNPAQSTSYQYDGNGNMTYEFRTRTVGGRQCTLTRQITPDGDKFSAWVNEFPGGTNLLHTPLTEVALKFAEPEASGVIREISGKKPDGTLVKIIITNDKIEIILSSVIAEMPFGEGRAIVVKENVGGVEKMFAHIEMPDGKGGWITLRTFGDIRDYETWPNPGGPHQINILLGAGLKLLTPEGAVYILIEDNRARYVTERSVKSASLGDLTEYVSYQLKSYQDGPRLDKSAEQWRDSIHWVQDIFYKYDNQGRFEGRIIQRAAPRATANAEWLYINETVAPETGATEYLVQYIRKNTKGELVKSSWRTSSLEMSYEHNGAADILTGVRLITAEGRTLIAEIGESRISVREIMHEMAFGKGKVVVEKLIGEADKDIFAVNFLSSGGVLVKSVPVSSYQTGEGPVSNPYKYLYFNPVDNAEFGYSATIYDWSGKHQNMDTRREVILPEAGKMVITERFYLVEVQGQWLLRKDGQWSSGNPDLNQSHGFFYDSNTGAMTGQWYTRYLGERGLSFNWSDDKAGNRKFILSYQFWSNENRDYITKAFEITGVTHSYDEGDGFGLLKFIHGTTLSGAEITVRIENGKITGLEFLEQAAKVGASISDGVYDFDGNGVIDQEDLGILRTAYRNAIQYQSILNDAIVRNLDRDGLNGIDEADLGEVVRIMEALINPAVPYRLVVDHDANVTILTEMDPETGEAVRSKVYQGIYEEIALLEGATLLQMTVYLEGGAKMVLNYEAGETTWMAADESRMDIYLGLVEDPAELDPANLIRTLIVISDFQHLVLIYELNETWLESFSPETGLLLERYVYGGIYHDESELGGSIRSIHFISPEKTVILNYAEPVQTIVVTFLEDGRVKQEIYDWVNGIDPEDVSNFILLTIIVDGEIIFDVSDDIQTAKDSLAELLGLSEEEKASIRVEWAIEGGRTSGCDIWGNGMCLAYFEYNSVGLRLDGHIFEFRNGNIDPRMLAMVKAKDQLQELLNLTDEQRADIQLMSASAQQWNDGCVGWSVPGQMCTMAIVNDYRVVLSLYGNEYEFRAGRLDPAKKSAIIAINDMVLSGYRLEDIRINSALLAGVPGSLRDWPAVYNITLSYKNERWLYKVDYQSQRILLKRRMLILSDYRLSSPVQPLTLALQDANLIARKEL